MVDTSDGFARVGDLSDAPLEQVVVVPDAPAYVKNDDLNFQEKKRRRRVDATQF